MDITTPGIERGTDREAVDVVVVGAGQAGLATGYHLAGTGRDFVILDSSDRVGDVWRRRWDSLRLFTPAVFNGLPGFPFPAPPHHYPSKDEMADYLEAYVDRFDLPVRLGTRVTRVSPEGNAYVVETDRATYVTPAVIVAMSGYQRPRVPAWAGELDPGIHQVHPAGFRNEGDLHGRVLVVGAATSGAELALLSARAGHETTLVGRDVGEIPFRPEGLLGRAVLVRLVLRLVFHRVLTVRTPIGRRARPGILSQGAPRVRDKARDVTAAGIDWHRGRVVGVRDGRPELDDGRVLDVDTVVWCTGFLPDHSWIDLPVFGDHEPLHHEGIVDAAPGLYFVGLTFLHALSSSMVQGVGRDAERVIAHLEANVPSCASLLAG